MAIDTDCPSCGQNHHLRDELDGRKIRCKSCSKPFRVEHSASPEDDPWSHDDYGDEDYGDEDYEYGQGNHVAQSAPLPNRSRKSRKRTQSARKSATKKPAWQLPVGILGIVAGVGLTAFGIWALVDGRRKAGRATYGGIVLLIGAIKLAFGSDDE